MGAAILYLNRDYLRDFSHLCCRSLSDLNRKMDDDYKTEIDEIYKRLSAKNQEKLADLLAKQEEDEEELRETTKNLPNKVNSAKC